MSVPEPPVPAPRSPRRGRALHKGQQTKAAILDAALTLATQIGLEGLSIGALAEATGMSKSGVFAHFGSREELQISVIHEYHTRFEEEVFYPSMQEPRGLPRLRALFRHWMNRTSVEIDSGCLYISGAVEFDDRPGPVRDALVNSVKSWLGALQRAIGQSREEGHLRSNIDEQQLAFEIHGLILALHYEARLLRSPGSIERAKAAFENLLKLYGARSAPADRSTPSTRSPKA
ncbi:MAG: TetR/AcrR family transcriptional regulator [Ramlibacter sp.]